MYARYTEFLRDLMLNEQTRNALNRALSTYPLYAPSKTYDLIPTREALNQKLLNHYKYHEIGFETVGRFLDELEITMCEIMPHYNELFKTVEIMAELPNPFDNVDVTETFEQTQTNTVNTEGTTTNTQTGEGSSSGTNTQTGSQTQNGTVEASSNTDQSATSRSIKTDTPQNDVGGFFTALDGGEYEGVYASEAEHQKNDAEATESRSETSTNSVENSSNGTSTTETTSTNTENGTSTGSSESTGTTSHTFTKKGNQGVNTYAHDMNEFRTSIMDVVDQIINDERIADLFMKVY